MKHVLIALLLMLAFPALALDGADYVLRNAAVYTVDANRSWAEAIAIRGDRIVFVGLDSKVNAYIGGKTEVLDLNGAMVLPGFQDSHIHPVTAALKSSMCSLKGLTSRDAYFQRIRQCVEDNPDARWIHGAGWSHRYFDQDNPPTRYQLDEITSDTPLTLASYDGHSLWANSAAIEAAGINRRTPDVAAGEIVRLPGSRVPSGLFLEDQALDAIMVAKPPYSSEEVYRALMSAQKYLNSLGITTIQDAMVEIGKNSQFGVLPSYIEAEKRGELSMRIVASLYWNPDRGMEQITALKKTRDKFSTALVKAGTVKVWLDGVMHTHTSRLLQPYADKPDEYGMLMLSVERLNALTVALDREGFQLHYHGDGDAAVRYCLDALALAREENGRNDNRHHIAHLELVHPSDIPRFRQLGVVANVQPMWSTSKAYISDLIDVKIGRERRRWLEINRSFLDQGVTVAYGSDWFVTSPNPMDLIEAAITRIRPALPLAEKRNSFPLLPDENVSLADAIASYTINGAWVNHQEDTTGSLEVGKLADLVVLEKNLFEVEPVRISETRVLLTFMGGKLVYGELPPNSARSTTE